MIGALGRQSLESVVREISNPILGDEYPVKSLKRRRGALIRPGEAATKKMQLLKIHIIQEVTEGAHHAPIETALVLVLGLVNEVEITPNKPQAWTSLTYLPKLLQK